MGRIRTIKPEFWTSETLARVPIRARLTFAGVWTYVDDNGVGRDNHCLITSEVYPLEPDPREARDSTRDDLASLAAQGLIVRYIVGGRRYLKVTNWEEHQRIDRPSKPRYPQPDVAEAEVLDPGRARALDMEAWPTAEPASDPRDRYARRVARRRTIRFVIYGRRYVMRTARRPQHRDDSTHPTGRPARQSIRIDPCTGVWPAQTATTQLAVHGATRLPREGDARPQRPEQGAGNREQGARNRDQGAGDTHLVIAALPLPGTAVEPAVEHTAAVTHRRPRRLEAEVAAAFDRFWAAYPKRVAKQDARKAWNQIANDPDVDLDEIIAGAGRYRDDGQRRRGGSRYTAHPGTWLRQGRWLDELTSHTPEPQLSTADLRVRDGLAVAAKFEAMEERGEI
ncbi:hypothetical protein AB0B66_10680 [Catellatospora sp. NPDC049111]|uniref:hypothetical protein n=1 Tax=Catellatospora sp. NPDC049111 TaxID=3155271 RepID=UPI0033F2FC08